MHARGDALTIRRNSNPLNGLIFSLRNCVDVQHNLVARAFATMRGEELVAAANARLPVWRFVLGQYSQRTTLSQTDRAILTLFAAAERLTHSVATETSQIDPTLQESTDEVCSVCKRAIPFTCSVNARCEGGHPFGACV